MTPRPLLSAHSRRAVDVGTEPPLVGEGVGAVRYCRFTTGDFIEPITAWDEPRRLAFDIDTAPPPMKELSPWDIDPPHLHGLFVSERGEFLLEELPGGRTLLTGTSWYRHDIRPAIYWQLWNEKLMHDIHVRVLSHIKRLSESGASS